MSGKGIHIIVRAALPEGGRRKGNIEMYEDGRFFALTGRILSNLPTTVETRQDEVQRFTRRFFNAATSTAGSTRSSRPSALLDLCDADLLARARKAKNGEKFRALYDDGDTTEHDGDDSAADLALTSMLMFWASTDPVRTDTLFRRSALYREKWDERHPGDGRTYGQMTLDAATDPGRPGYDPHLMPAEIDPALPSISGFNEHWHLVVEETRSALLLANDPPRVFRTPHGPATIGRDTAGRYEVHPVEANGLTIRISSATNWVGRSGERTALKSPPLRIAEALLSERDARFPVWGNN